MKQIHFLKSGLAALFGAFFFGGFFMAAVASADQWDSSGWTFLTEQDLGASLTHVKVVVRSGSLSDPSVLPGLAHFTAKAMLRGTETRPYQELNDSIEKLGATISISVDQTATVLDAAVITENLDSFLIILRDILTAPAFSVTEMNLLQRILFGELAADLQEPRVLAARAMLLASYAGTSLKSPIKGVIQSVANITPQDVRGFFEKSYVRENMIIGVTSPMTRDDVVAKLSMRLDSVPHGALDAPKFPPASLHGRKAVIVDQKGMSTMPVFFGTPGVADADPKMPALEVGNFVFGDDFTSRLMQVLRVQNGWTYGAYSNYAQVLRPQAEAGLFSVYLFPSAEFSAQALPKTLGLLNDYVSHGITADELRFAQDALVNQYPFQMDTAEKRIEQQLRAALTGRAVLSPGQYASEIGTLDLVTVNSAIASQTHLKNLIISVVGDADVLKPILSSIVGAKSVQVVQINP